MDGVPVSCDRRTVRWLEESQQPPAAVPAETLTPLLPDGATLVQWERRKAELRRVWDEFLSPPQRISASRRAYNQTPSVERPNIEHPVASAVPVSVADGPGTPAFEVLESENLPGVTRQRIRYQTEPGWNVEAYLLRPSSEVSGPMPGVMVFHSTVPETIRQPAGIEGEPEKAFGLELARRGYMALCPRCFLWQSDHERFFQWHARREVRRLRRRHSRTKGIAKMLRDAQIGLDLLANLPDVDENRLGAVGHSLGGKQVLYLAAFDERIRVAVSSEGGIGRSHSNWSAPWYLGRADPSREHHELLGMIAPRAFLLVGGDSADGDHSWPFLEEALRVYRLHDPRLLMGLYNHHQGHTVPQEATQRIYEWFDAYL